MERFPEEFLNKSKNELPKEALEEFLEEYLEEFYRNTKTSIAIVILGGFPPDYRRKFHSNSERIIIPESFLFAEPSKHSCKLLKDRKFGKPCFKRFLNEKAHEISSNYL